MRLFLGLKKQKYSQEDLDLTKLDLTTRYKENHELPSDTVMEEIQPALVVRI